MATEDSKRYRDAVTYYNHQLATVLGLSEDALDRIRRRCIDAGWLHYEPGYKHRLGRYWVTVPNHFDDELPDDRPLGATPGELSSASMQRKAEPIPPHYCGGNRGETAEQSAEEPRRKPGETAEPSYLSLNPNPRPPSAPEPDGRRPEMKELTERLAKAGIEKAPETAAEALENGLTLDQIAGILDHFQSTPGAYGPGALRVRLTRPSARWLEPSAGWPPPNAAALASAQREALAQAEAAAAPELLAELLGHAKTPLAILKNKGPKHPMIRPALLGAFAERYGKAQGAFPP